MSRCPARRSRLRASSAPDPLEELARLLEEAAEEEGWGRRPHLVRVAEAGPDGLRLELGTRAFIHGVHDDVEHPVDALAGFEAPRGWRALGVVFEGTAHEPCELPAASGSDGGDPCGGSRRARVVHLVARDGASASVLRVRGDAPLRGFARGVADAPGGRVDDVLRRSLGLPTAGPGEPTVTLWALVWLDRLLADRAGAGADAPRLDWAGAARLHPAVEIVQEVHAAPCELSVGEVSRLGHRLGRARDWEALRAACARGSWSVPEVPADLAAWMDSGIFSRWVTGAYPHPGELFAAVVELVPTATATAIASALGSWDVAHTVA